MGRSGNAHEECRKESYGEQEQSDIDKQLPLRTAGIAVHIDAIGPGRNALNVKIL